MKKVYCLVANTGLGACYGARRVLRGWNQSDVGSKIGVSQGTISLFELGIKQDDSVKLLLDCLFSGFETGGRCEV